MAGFTKPQWRSRALRPGDTDTPPFKPGKAAPRVSAGASPSPSPASDAAPHKTEMDKFQSKWGFGTTGMTGRS